MSATPAGPLPPGLARQRHLARLVLWWEAVWPALWPTLGVVGLFLILALGGVIQLLPPLLHAGVLAGFALAFGWAIRAAWPAFRSPHRDHAERRLERDSRLAHRPLAALRDRPAVQDPAALALWEAHRERSAAALRALALSWPKPGLARRDRRALRAGLLVALVAALVVARDDAGERLRRAFVPGFTMPAVAMAPVLRIEAWVTPPAYTGAAPIFLDPAGGAVVVPQGSRLQVSLSGGALDASPPELALDDTVVVFRVLDRGSFSIESVLTEGGRLAIRRDGREVVHWLLTVRADTPPAVAFDGTPARAQRGLATRIPWRVEDDWGVHSVQAEIRLTARPSAEPMVIELPLPAGLPRQARGAAQPDLSAHPWAGLDVTLRLVARDGADQEGVSEEATLTLPERSFSHPVAQALIAVRRALSLDPEARTPARAELDRITAAPESFEHDTATFLALRAARHRLVRDRRAGAVPEVQEILWEVALALEEGRADRTARALAAAREQLREAIEQAQRDNQVTDQERADLQRRIEELREAIRRHLEALAERLQRENAEALPFDPQQRLMDQRELDRRTRRMQESSREGRLDDTRRELAELEEMLRALEEGRSARNESPERQRQRQRGQQQMGAVQDMVRRQMDMLDRSHRRADNAERERAQARRTPPPGQRQPQPGQPQAGEQDERTRAEAQQDARTQRALRRALGELMQQYGDLTGEVPEQLGRADRAMSEAGDALREGRDPRDAQGRAIRALTEGSRQMAQQMQRQFGQQPGEGEEEGEGDDMAGNPEQGGQGQDQAQEQGPGRDPLGRRTREAPGAQDNGSDTRVPDEAEMLRTRRLQEELRRRGAERERLPAELDYIDRLLRRF